MRKASITMSWLADRKATATASAAIATGAAAGSEKPSRRIATASRAWIAISQARRRPKRRPAGAAGMRSISGDQTYLKL